MEILLGTSNPDKVKEIKDFFQGLPIKIRTLQELGLKGEVEETGKTFEENARIKARFWWERTGGWVLTDDSGLEVDVLKGAPGVLSSRYAGEKATYEDNWKKLLRELEGVPWEKRRARFRCVMILLSPEGREFKVEGIVEGYILEEPRGNSGFGYDPVFYIPEKGKTFAEMSLEEKNLLSHRGEALRKMKEVILSFFHDKVDSS